MKWITILECPYCGNGLEEIFSACCKEAGHGEWIEVCADCWGEGSIVKRGYGEICYASCLKCRGTGGRNE